MQVLKGKLSHLAKYKSDRLYSPLFFVIFHPHPMPKIRLPDGENIGHVSLKLGDKEKQRHGGTTKGTKMCNERIMKRAD